jgi:hypothetical protein
MSKNRLFLDMDGVFCDFEREVQERTGRSSEEIPDDELWPILSDPTQPNFFEHLSWMASGKDLWEAVLTLVAELDQPPIFLTGCPSQATFRALAEKGKEAWVRSHCLETGGHIHTMSVDSGATLKSAAEYIEKLEELVRRATPKDIIMIFCRPRQKYFFSRTDEYTAILLDDRAAAGELWTSPPIFVWHESTPAKANFKSKSKRNTKSTNAVRKSKGRLQNFTRRNHVLH